MSNIKFQLQIKVCNYNKPNHTYNTDLLANDLQKFTSLIKLIHKNINKTYWNWFDKLPEIWDGNTYILDLYTIKDKLLENFEYKVEDINLFKEFYNKFTPNGADRIDSIKVLKIEEIKLK